MSAYGGRVLLDMSAWGRVLLDGFAQDDRERFEQAVRDGDVVVSEPFLLEALCFARDAADHARLAEHLAALPFAASPPGVLGLALDAQHVSRASPRSRIMSSRSTFSSRRSPTSMRAASCATTATTT